MLKLDQESDQNVSANWRRVASTHSFQVLCTFRVISQGLQVATRLRLAGDVLCRSFWASTNSVTKPMGLQQHSGGNRHACFCKRMPLYWFSGLHSHGTCRLLLISAAGALLFGTVFCLVVSLPNQNHTAINTLQCTWLWITCWCSLPYVCICRCAKSSPQHRTCSCGTSNRISFMHCWSLWLYQ